MRRDERRHRDVSGRGAQRKRTGGPGRREKQVTFTKADLEQLERGWRTEIEAVKAAQKKATSAATAQERGQAIQAQWETATIPAGATASDCRSNAPRHPQEVDRVLTILDFQGKIDGPLSIDLERADADTKARVAGDAFAELPAPAAATLHQWIVWCRSDRSKKLVAVAG